MISITHQQLLLFRSANKQGTKQRRSSEVYVGAIALICLIHMLPDLRLYGKNQVNELP
jgi:hypothetical protein